MGGPRLRYAIIDGMEYGSKLIHVSAQSPPATPKTTTIKSIYPNPVFDFATVEIAVEKSGFLHIRLFDVIGRQLRSTIIFSGVGTSRHTLDLKEIPSGAYFIHVEDSGGMSSNHSITIAR
ncbi:MAG: T9SS type A sorting domain-containing protein [Bacteroidetes bacterium]|nr:T9SS type A sorting domain-containing protein [Bacteroidota bacterium]